MIILYHCYRGAHLSMVATALHLKKIHPSSGSKDILGLKYFDKLQSQDMGVPVLAGLDENDNLVYFMGLGQGSRIYTRFLNSLVEELGLDIECKSVDCLSCLTPLIRIGGFLSRYRQSRYLGRRLAAWGVHKNLKRIEALVLQARER